MEKNEERLKVIDNIEKAIEEGDLNRKVELGDPVITQEEREFFVVNLKVNGSTAPGNIESGITSFTISTEPSVSSETFDGAI